MPTTTNEFAIIQGIRYRAGDKVLIQHGNINGTWISGYVQCIHPYLRSADKLCVVRDDGMKGGGCNRAWMIYDGSSLCECHNIRLASPNNEDNPFFNAIVDKTLHRVPIYKQKCNRCDLPENEYTCEPSVCPYCEEYIGDGCNCCQTCGEDLDDCIC